jgi:hypothetical protein
MSAESELGTLPVSLLSLRYLHTRSGLGRCGGATSHPQQPCAPTVPAHRTHGRGCPLSTPYSHRGQGSRLRAPQQALLSHRPRSMPPTCIPPTCCALGAEPTDPTLLGRTRKRCWQEGGKHSLSRLVSAESELGTLPVSLLLQRKLHIRSGLGRCGGATSHPQQPCAPTVPAHRTHGRGCPLSTPSSHRVQGSALRAPQQALLSHRPRSMLPTCIPRHAARSEQSRPIRPFSAARASAVGSRRARTGL